MENIVRIKGVTYIYRALDLTLVQGEHSYGRHQLECHACVELSSPLREVRNGTNQNQTHF